MRSHGEEWSQQKGIEELKTTIVLFG